MYRLLLRSELRRRGWAWLAVAVIGGLAGTFVLTAAAGARRTASAFTRFQHATRSPDFAFSPQGRADPGALARLRATRGVVAVVGFSYFPVVPERAGVRAFENANAFGPLGLQFGTEVYRYLVLEGRRADERRADEVTVNPELAKLAHLHVGQRVRLTSPVDVGHPLVTVVGIHRGEFDVGPNAANASMLLTSAFTATVVDRFYAASDQFRPAYLVRVDHREPRAMARVRAATLELFPGTVVQPSPSAVTDGIRVQATALAILAAIAGLATVVALAQAAGRLALAGADDRVLLAALGVTTGGNVIAATIPALLAGVAAAVLAVVGAALASGIHPTGLARQVEPAPGLRLDALVLVLGAVAVVVTTLAGPLRHTLRRRASAGSTGQPPPGWSHLSGPHSIGVRAAVAGLVPRVRVQARTAIVAVVAAVVGLTAVQVFGASQRHLFAAPRLQGFAWDLSLRPPPERMDALRDTALKSRAVDGLAEVAFSQLKAGGRTLEAFVVTSLRGDVHPTVLAGRAPVGGDEIALPPASTGVTGRLGQMVSVTGSGATVAMRVVGRAVYPGMGPIGDFNNAASITPAGASRLGLEPQPGDTTLFVHLAPGQNGASLVRAGGDDTEVVRPFLVPTLTNLHRAGRTPDVLALFLAVLGAAGLIHALLIAMRMGRRELGVLRAVGCTRRQIRAVLTWQALATVAVGSAIGVPLGVAAGRWSWIAVARHLGVVDRTVVPVNLAGVVAIGFALAWAVAAAVGHRAARLPATVTLRTE